MKSLFIDRDGVINHKIANGYVTNWSQFVFRPGVLEALAELSRSFELIVLVTNQQGIGKGLMNEEDLKEIHLKMMGQIHERKGRIDAVYHCPHLASAECSCRKPNTGMGLQADQDHGPIDFDISWMVGDSDSDILFGERLGLRTALVNSAGPAVHSGDVKPDKKFSTLLEFSHFIIKSSK